MHSAFNGVTSAVEKIMKEGNPIIKFHIDKKSVLGKVWRQFPKKATIKTSMNYVLKQTAKELLGKTKYDISEKESNRIRERHQKLLIRTMNNDEWVTAWHSLLIDTKGIPSGFVTMVERDGEYYSFITQSLDDNAKHIVCHPPVIMDSTIMFRSNAYDDMVNGFWINQ